MGCHLLADHSSSWGRVGPQLHQLTTTPGPLGHLTQDLLLCLVLVHTLEASRFFFRATEGYWVR